MSIFKLLPLLFTILLSTSNGQEPVQKSLESVNQTTKKPLICDEMGALIVEKNPSVQLLPLTKELMAKHGLEKWAEFDPGFPKWVVVFNKIPGEPPYVLQERRINQSNPTVFIDREDAYQPGDIVLAKSLGQPFRFVISARGYLPGEKVTWRLATKEKNVFREITVYLRPLILNKKSGEVLLQANLESYPFNLTRYSIHISGIKEKERVRMISKSGAEKLRHVQQGPIFMNYAPGVVGKPGGISKLEFHFEDGEYCQIELPWGTALNPYKNGKK